MFRSLPPNRTSPNRSLSALTIVDGCGSPRTSTIRPAANTPTIRSAGFRSWKTPTATVSSTKRRRSPTTLTFTSGLALGFGGVFVGSPPNLSFIPDADGDDKPDGPPQVLLDGWGINDRHETLNSFIWGPDGWLYGCHGVFTHSQRGQARR